MKKTPTLKSRMIMAIVGLELGLVSVLAVVTYTTLTSGFKKLEVQIVSLNIKRATVSIDSIVSNYDKKVIDWAEWDDTYNFIKDLNNEYKVSNLVEETMLNLHVDEMLFFDESGVLKYATAPAGILAKEPTFPEDVEDFLIDNEKIISDLTANNISSGLVKTEDGIMMYSAHSITKSNGMGESVGTIVFARYIGPWLEEDMSNIIQLPVIRGMGSDHKANKANPITVDAKNKKVYGHFWLPVVNDTEEVVFQFEMNRDIWIEGLTDMNILLLSSGLTTLILGIVSYFILHKAIISDLLKLGSEITEITKKSGAGLTQKQGVNFEIDQMRENVNLLLSVIDKSKKETESKAGDFDKINKLMVGRELKMIELKNEIEDLKKEKKDA